MCLPTVSARYDTREHAIFPPSRNVARRSLQPFPSVHDAAQLAITVVVPAYKEKLRMPTMLDEMKGVLDELYPSSWEIIIVDDGSPDDGATSSVAWEYSEKWGADKLRLCRLHQNHGKGGAVRKGALRARGAFVLMADADGATRASDVEALHRALLKELENKTPGKAKAASLAASTGASSAGALSEGSLSDPAVLALGSRAAGMAVGSRAAMEEQRAAMSGSGSGSGSGSSGSASSEEGGPTVNRSPLRKLLQWGFHTGIMVLGGGHSIKDTQCGFKLFTRAAARRLFPVLHIERWAFDVELVMVAHRLQMALVEVPVHWHEVDGSTLDPLTAALQMARDVLAIALFYGVGLWSDAVPKEEAGAGAGAVGAGVGAGAGAGAAVRGGSKSD